MCILRHTFSGIIEVEDPVTGDRSLMYKDTSDMKKMALFNSYSHKEKMELLSAYCYPIFPLKDTIIIIDSMSALSSNLTFQQGCYYFKTEEKYLYKNEWHTSNARNGNYSYLYLKWFGLRNNVAGLIFSFDKNNEMFSCSYKLGNCVPTLIKAGSCCGWY